MNKIRIYLLAIKYYFKGEDWVNALYYANLLVNGFKTEEK